MMQLLGENMPSRQSLCQTMRISVNNRFILGLTKETNSNEQHVSIIRNYCRLKSGAEILNSERLSA